MSSEEEKFTTTGVLVEFTTSAEALAAYRRAVEKAETDVLKAITGGDLQQAGNVPFFTPSPAPIPPTAYHNVFPPVTSEGIQEAIAKLRTNRLDHEYADDCQCEDCQWAKMHRRHPLDVPEFGAEWLRRWEAVGRLLEKPAMVGVRQGNTERVEWYKLSAKYGRTVAHCLTHAIERRRVDPKLPMVARLLDGTIIREWGPK